MGSLDKQFKTLFLFLYITLYSLVLFLSVLIHPYLTLDLSNLVPTWQTFPLLDLFHLMSWNRLPIRFCHLSAARGFDCSIATLLILPLGFLHFWFQEISPLSSNLIDMKESTICYNIWDRFKFSKKNDKLVSIKIFKSLEKQLSFLINLMSTR